jgi:PAS domain S-box-containing protein
MKDINSDTGNKSIHREHDNEAWCRDILEAMGDIVYKVNVAGEFIYVNRSINKLEYSPEEIIGRHFSTIIHPDHVDRVSREVVLPIFKGKVTGDDHAPKLFDERRGGPRMTRELEIMLIPKGWSREHGEKKCRIGTAVTVGYISASGQYESNRPLLPSVFSGTIGLIRDVTERKRLEEELLKAEIQKSLNFLTAGIVHDFNNALTSIINNISLAKLNAEKPLELWDFLMQAEKSGHHARALTRQLLAFAKGEQPATQPTSVKALVENSLDLVVKGSSIFCMRDIPGDVWPVETDFIQMTAAINNILLNAIQAMPQGGTIWIRARNTTLPAQNTYSLTSGNYVTISVEDEGPGISPEKMCSIFTPYFTTKEQGSGLGLALTHSVVKRHGGHLAASSTQGKGSVFSMIIPATSAS